MYTYQKRKEKMTMKVSKMFGGLALVASVFLLTACGSGNQKDTSVSDIKDKGTLVVAMNPEFAPFEFKTLVDGKDTIVGAYVEIAKAIGEELGVKVFWQVFNQVKLMWLSQVFQQRLNVKKLIISQKLITNQKMLY